MSLLVQFLRALLFLQKFLWYEWRAPWQVFKVYNMFLFWGLDAIKCRVYFLVKFPAMTIKIEEVCHEKNWISRDNFIVDTIWPLVQLLYKSSFLQASKQALLRKYLSLSELHSFPFVFESYLVYYDKFSCFLLSISSGAAAGNNFT